ncbi:MAG: hypothetical protein M5U22_22330 [Thermoleophilia bacterium]|nr:hypothetical protein [Thermoleophilia bacterium]
MRVRLEIVEENAGGPTCSTKDRRTFARRTVDRLRDEFGDRLDVVWQEPQPETCTLPATYVGGQLVHRGGYLPWEILRPVVASALAVEEGVQALTREAVAALEELGLEAEDWQQGLLSWLERQREE